MNNNLKEKLESLEELTQEEFNFLSEEDCERHSLIRLVLDSDFNIKPKHYFSSHLEIKALDDISITCSKFFNKIDIDANDNKVDFNTHKQVKKINLTNGTFNLHFDIAPETLSLKDGLFKISSYYLENLIINEKVVLEENLDEVHRVKLEDISYHPILNKTKNYFLGVDQDIELKEEGFKNLKFLTVSFRNNNDHLNIKHSKLEDLTFLLKQEQKSCQITLDTPLIKYITSAQNGSCLTTKCQKTVNLLHKFKVNYALIEDSLLEKL